MSPEMRTNFLNSSPTLLKQGAALFAATHRAGWTRTRRFARWVVQSHVKIGFLSEPNNQNWKKWAPSIMHTNMGALQLWTSPTMRQLHRRRVVKVLASAHVPHIMNQLCQEMPPSASACLILAMASGRSDRLTPKCKNHMYSGPKG